MVEVREKNEPDKEEKSEKGTFAKMKKGLTEGLRKGTKSLGRGAGLLLLSGLLAGCGSGVVADDGETPTFPDGGDGKQDTMVDAGEDAGSDMDLDAGVDAGPDLDVDAGVDAGPDVDVGDGDETTVVCQGVEDVPLTEVTFPKGEDTEIGGYLVRYVSAAGPAGANIEIRCASGTDDSVVTQRLAPETETFIELPDKMMVITIKSQNVGRIICDVTVQDL